MIFFDTETCGLHGMAVLIQYAYDDEEIQLYDIWNNPIIDTLKLIEDFANHPEGVCGFNLAFDWFHLCKLYTTFSLHPDPSAYPVDCIDEIAVLEEKARFTDICLKPVTAIDLMLHARKGPYQSTMDRHEIRIKKVPTVLVWKVAEYLEENIQFNEVYFARRKTPGPKWKVYDIKDDLDNVIIAFKDIVLKFAPSSALKALAVDALGAKEDYVLKFTDIEPPGAKAVEKGWAPFALAIGSPNNWKGAWPEIIQWHIEHWAYNSMARVYATDDVVYTRDLYKHFGCPPSGDDDSVLACMVAAVRWSGFAIDVKQIEELRVQKLVTLSKYPPSLATAPHIARRYLEQHMDITEKTILGGSTKAVLLKEISEWENDDGTRHPAATAAKEILAARGAKKEIELLDKLLTAGRFHASFKVIGTLSSRMSGSDGLNPQGINHSPIIRGCFTLADDGQLLVGGDFDGFEVTIAEALYNDATLRQLILSGKKLHAVFAQELYPGQEYGDIMASKGSDELDMYGKGKSGVFAMIYGGNENTLQNNLGITEETATDAYNNFAKKYPGVGRARKKIHDDFCSMRQPAGIGTKVEWHDPAEYVESMLGFRRYFTLENDICKTLFDLAEKPPKEWLKAKVKVTRRDRQQTASGAVRSALFAAAFAIQAANMRAASNHQIQSTGAQITKNLERKIWDIQPVGVGAWVVKPMNIHDEVMATTQTKYVGQIHTTVTECVESFRSKIPLIKMEWNDKLNTWADK